MILVSGTMHPNGLVSSVPHQIFSTSFGHQDGHQEYSHPPSHVKDSHHHHGGNHHRHPFGKLKTLLKGNKKPRGGHSETSMWSIFGGNKKSCHEQAMRVSSVKTAYDDYMKKLNEKITICKLNSNKIPKNDEFIKFNYFNKNKNYSNFL
jgi:hypothetical protein